MRKIKQKVKRVGTHAVLVVHKNSHKSRTVCEALSCIFIAIETHLILFSALAIIWLMIDMLDLIELTCKLGQRPEDSAEPNGRVHKHRAKAAG